MKKTVIYDWNGTLLDDLDLCIELLNNMLSKRDIPTVDKIKYKEIFTFPVKDYYLAAGFDFFKESFESLAPEFMNPYVERYTECSLVKNVKEVLESLKNMNMNIVVLSATKHDYLIEQVSAFNIDHYFTEMIGIKDIHAKGKIEEARDWMLKNDLNPDECIMIGDSIHDSEVAESLGIDCLLITTGHQSKHRLETTKRPIIDNHLQLLEYLKAE